MTMTTEETIKAMSIATDITNAIQMAAEGCYWHTVTLPLTELCGCAIGEYDFNVELHDGVYKLTELYDTENGCMMPQTFCQAVEKLINMTV